MQSCDPREIASTLFVDLDVEIPVSVTNMLLHLAQCTLRPSSRRVRTSVSELRLLVNRAVNPPSGRSRGRLCVKASSKRLISRQWRRAFGGLGQQIQVGWPVCILFAIALLSVSIGRAARSAGAHDQATGATGARSESGTLRSRVAEYRY